MHCNASKIRPGTLIQWSGVNLFIDRVELHPLSNTVSLFAAGRELTLEWDQGVEVIADDLPATGVE